MAKLLLTATLLFSTQAFAYTQVTSVTNGQNVNIVNPQTATTTTPGSTTPTTPNQPGTTTSVTVYGGIGGPDCTSTASNSAPCNSCPGAATTGCNDSSGTNNSPLCACNQNRIYNSLPITINVTRSVNPGGGYLHISAGATSTGTNTLYTDLVPATATNSITLTWQTVCATLSTATNGCEGLNNQTIQLNLWTDNSIQTSGQQGTYVAGTDDLIPITFRIIEPQTSEDVYGDTLTEGIGQFTPYPGDQRIYLNELDTVSNFPNSLSAGASIQNVQVILSSTSLANATIQSADQSPLLGVSGSAVSPTYIGNVTDGVGYFVRLAMVDQAGNILQYFPGLSANTQTGCDGTGDVTQCPYYVRPGQVAGSLPNDFDCFIANAAYGTLLEPKLKILREFRNRILLQTNMGKRFVLAYYMYGPYAARFIADKPFLRFVTRGLLWPVVGFSYGWLHLGFTSTLLLSLLLLSLILALPLYGMRRRRARG